MQTEDFHESLKGFIAMSLPISVMTTLFENSFKVTDAEVMDNIVNFTITLVDGSLNAIEEAVKNALFDKVFYFFP